MKLFCLPFAGGSAYSYRDLEVALADTFEVTRVELPGRGRRFGEPLLTDLGSMARDVVTRIEGELRAPYALFGHSMGATLSYLVHGELARRGLPAPALLVVSGQRPPFLPRRGPARHRMTDPELREEIRRMGGCPPEVLADAELMELFTPVLRADFEANETFRPLPAPDPLGIPILALAGEEDDDPTPDEVESWKEMTRARFEVHRFPGGHFFLLDDPPAVGARLEERLGALLAGAPEAQSL